MGLLGFTGIYCDPSRILHNSRRLFKDLWDSFAVSNVFENISLTLENLSGTLTDFFFENLECHTDDSFELFMNCVEVFMNKTVPEFCY